MLTSTPCLIAEGTFHQCVPCYSNWWIIVRNCQWILLEVLTGCVKIRKEWQLRNGMETLWKSILKEKRGRVWVFPLICFIYIFAFWLSPSVTNSACNRIWTAQWVHRITMNPFIACLPSNYHMLITVRIIFGSRPSNWSNWWWQIRLNEAVVTKLI